MRTTAARLVALSVLLSVALGATSLTASAAARRTAHVASGGTWSAATATGAALLAVSCPAPGDCVAGGSSYAGQQPGHALLDDEIAGVWRAPMPVPGIGALRSGRGSAIRSVSCASPGNCTAVGASDAVGFAVTETAGTWGSVTAVAGAALLDTVSCSSPGTCSAGGQDPSAHPLGAPPYPQAVVADEVAGTWGAAVDVPGTVALNDYAGPYGEGAEVTSISCTATGTCAAGGYVQGSSGDVAFLVDEATGIWGTAEQVAGLAAFSTAPFNSSVASVSCTSPGVCTAGGSFAGIPGLSQGFLVSESGHGWGNAVSPSTGTFNGRAPIGGITVVSCVSSGYCAAGGAVGLHPFVLDRVRGSWGRASGLPGNPEGFIDALSCAAPGDCSAGGQVDRPTLNARWDVVINESAGRWGVPFDLDGALPSRSSQGTTSSIVDAISCAAPGSCVAAGWRGGPRDDHRGFVATERPGSPPSLVSATPAHGPGSGGTSVLVRGHGFDGALSVSFAGRLGRHLHVLSDSSLVVTSPPGRGSSVLRVEGEAGVSPRATAVTFTYAPR